MTSYFQSPAVITHSYLEGIFAFCLFLSVLSSFLWREWTVMLSAKIVLFLFCCCCLTGWSKIPSMIMPVRMWCFVDLSRKSEFSHLRIRWVDSLYYWLGFHQCSSRILDDNILFHSHYILWRFVKKIYISSFYADNRLFSYTIHPYNSFLFLLSNHLLPIFPLP